MNQQRTALITGPTSGIGLELARLLAHDGYQIMLVARHKDQLEKLARELAQEFSIKTVSVVVDLGEPSAIQKVWDTTNQVNWEVDLLINNAGFGTSGRFDLLATDEEKNLINVNILALTLLTKQFLPMMVKRGHGAVLNVASTAAFQPGPFMATYYASKAYVLSFSEALSEELRGTGVTVTALCPGPTSTGFQARAKLTNSRLFTRPLASPAEVAQIGYRALLRGQRVVIPGLWNWLGTRLVQILPRSLVLPAISDLNQSRPSKTP